MTQLCDSGWRGVGPKLERTHFTHFAVSVSAAKSKGDIIAFNAWEAIKAGICIMLFICVGVKHHTCTLEISLLNTLLMKLTTPDLVYNVCIVKH